MPAEKRVANPELVGVDRIEGDAAPLAGSQTFKKGAFIKWGGSNFAEAANGDKLSLAIAVEDAAPAAYIWPATKSDVMYHTLKGQLVAINAYTATTNVPAIGTKYAIIKVGGVWRLNVDDSVTNPCATVKGLFHAGASYSDANVRVVVVFDDAACWVGSVA